MNKLYKYYKLINENELDLSNIDIVSVSVEEVSTSFGTKDGAIYKCLGVYKGYLDGAHYLDVACVLGGKELPEEVAQGLMGTTYGYPVRFFKDKIAFHKEESNTYLRVKQPFFSNLGGKESGRRY